MRRETYRDGETGQASLLMVAAVAVLLVAASVIILNLGRGLDYEAQPRTAADASALAAAEAYRQGLEDAVGSLHAGPTAADQLDHLFSLSLTDVATHSAQEANRLAQRNKSTVTDLRIEPELGGARFHVTAKGLEKLPGADRDPTFSAVAEVRLAGGALCARADGSLGLWRGGSCIPRSQLIFLGTAPPLPASPSPSASPTPTPTPTYPPGTYVFTGSDLADLIHELRFGSHEWQVRLVA